VSHKDYLSCLGGFTGHTLHRHRSSHPMARACTYAAPV
jgi:hypothetical protein